MTARTLGGEVIVEQAGGGRQLLSFPPAVERWIGKPIELIYAFYGLLFLVNVVVRNSVLFLIFLLVVWLPVLVASLGVCYFLPPLSKLSEKSLLMLRLVWFWRFTAAAALLSLSACIGIVAQAAFEERKDQGVTQRLSHTIDTVFVIVVPYAALAGATALGVWLGIDLFRSGKKRRRRAARRLSRLVSGKTRPLLVKLLTDLSHPVVSGLILYLTPITAWQVWNQLTTVG